MKRKIIWIILVGILAGISGGLIHYFYEVPEYNNTIFSAEKEKNIKKIVYWEGGKAVEIKNRLKIKKLYRMLAKEDLKKVEPAEPGKVGHFLMDIHYADSVVELGILNSELTVSSDDEEIAGLYNASDKLLTNLLDIL